MVNMRLETIRCWRRLRKALWIRACRYDGINANEKFVVFSEDNPHIKKLNSMGAE